MNKEIFVKGILGYIEAQKKYDALEAALYGHVLREGEMQESLYLMEESILEAYLLSLAGGEYLVNAAFDICWTYIEKCISEDGRNFDIDILQRIINDVVEETADE